MRPSLLFTALLLSGPVAGLVVVPGPSPVWAQEQPAVAGDAELAAAKMLLTGKKYAPAAMALEKFLAEFPQHPKLAEATTLLAEARGGMADELIVQGRAALAAKDEGKAGDALARALKLAEFDEKRAPLAGMLLGDLRFQQEKWSEAFEAYRQVARWTSATEAPRAFQRMGDSQRRLGNFSDAAIAYHNGSEQHWRDPLAPQLGLCAGEAYLDARLWREAEAEYRRVLRQFTESPQAPRAQLGLARIAFLIGDYAVARTAYQAAGIVFAKAIGPEAELRVADTYLAEKNLETARKGYLALLTSMDRSVAAEARYSLGRTYLEAGELGPASDHFGRLAAEKSAGSEAAPWSQRARLRLVEIREGAGDSAYLLKNLPVLLAEKPEGEVRSEAEFRLGRALLAKKDADGERLLAGLLTREPKGAWSDEASVLLADVRLEKGDTAQALKDAGDALKRPLSPDARAVALSVMGRAHLVLKQEAPGVAALTEVLEKHGTSPAANAAGKALVAHYRATQQTAKATELEQALGARVGGGGNSLTVALDQADRRLDAGGVEEARKLYLGILEQKPDRASRLRARAGLAEATALLKQPMVADAQLVELDRDVPSPAFQARTQARVARAFERSGESKRALTAYEAAYQALQTAGMDGVERGTVPAILSGLGRALSRNGKPAEAEPLLREVVEKHPTAPEAPEALYALAWGAQEAGRVEEAQRGFRKLTVDYARHPLAGDAHYRLAEASAAKSEWPAAVEHYRQALEGSGRSAEAAGYRLGWTLRKQKDHAGAAKAFQETATRFPKGAMALECRVRAGEEYLQTEQEKPALEQFQAAITGLGEPATEEGRELLVQAKVGAAWASLLAGDFDSARTLTEGLAVPANGWQGGRAQLARAEALFLKDGPKAALPEYRKAATLFGQHRDIAAEGLFRAGECYDKLKNSAGAKGAWQKAVDLYGDTEWAVRSREKLNAIPATESTPAPKVEEPTTPTPESVKPTKPKPAVVQPPRPKPTEVKPVETKPGGPKASELKPAENKPVSKPAALKTPVSKTDGAKPAAGKVAEAKPLSAKGKLSKTTAAKPAAGKAATAKAAATKPVKGKSSRSKSKGSEREPAAASRAKGKKKAETGKRKR